jgi:hypothetical protein
MRRPSQPVDGRPSVGDRIVRVAAPTGASEMSARDGGAESMTTNK